MPQFNIDDIEKRTLNGLKDFQRATVDRVDFLFRNGQNRVLVADEVGMGKTLIARGTIVKTARFVQGNLYLLKSEYSESEYQKTGCYREQCDWFGIRYQIVYAAS